MTRREHCPADATPAEFRAAMAAAGLAGDYTVTPRVEDPDFTAHVDAAIRLSRAQVIDITTARSKK